MSFHALLFAACAVTATLLSTSVHAVHVDPNDIVKTIESECGDIIDCVDVYKQPALKNRQFQDNKIQEPPKIKTLRNNLLGRNFSFPQQTWRRSGSCPEGTIPIRRRPTTAGADDKIANPFPSHGRATATDEKAQADGKLEIAAAYGVNGPYHGASAAIPMWKVQVAPNEFSMNYLLIASPHERHFTPISGKSPPDINNQIAVGMAVYPSVLGDDNPRLFIYATNDGGVTSNCFNQECGFIQTNNEYALGATWEKYSTVGGDLYFVQVSLYRETGPAVWWLSVEDVPIGYFDSGMFPVPFIESFHNEMGGRVLDTRPGGRHTMTPMGSGMFSSAGLNNAACIAYYMAFDNEGGDQVDDPVNTIVTNPKCYDVKDFGRDDNRPGIDIAYGGPGGYYCDQ
ncbi:hypothetical protein ACP70R_033882 [Stipagrostis hirtigluma subsp. patula]